MVSQRKFSHYFHWLRRRKSQSQAKNRFFFFIQIFFSDSQFSAIKRRIFLFLTNIVISSREEKKKNKRKNLSAKNPHSKLEKKKPETKPALNRQTLAFIVDYLNLCNKKHPFYRCLSPLLSYKTQQTKAKNKLQYRNLLTLCACRLRM